MNKSCDRLLVQFETLINKDYGVLKYIIDKYQGNPCVRDMTDQTREDIELMLANRLEANPLHLIMLEDGLYDDMYNEIISDPEFYNYCISSENIDKLCNITEKSTIAELTILCKNEFEEQLIKEIYGYTTTTKLDHNKFDSIVVMYKDFIADNASKLTDKTVYLAETKYNLEKYEDGTYNLDNRLLYIVLEYRVNIKFIPLFEFAESNIIKQEE